LIFRECVFEAYYLIEVLWDRGTWKHVRTQSCPSSEGDD